MLNRLFHTKGFSAVAFVMAVVAVVVALSNNLLLPIEGARGIAFDSPNLWQVPQMLSMAITLVVIAGIALTANAINKVFNIMRSQTGLTATFFIIFSLALPSIIGQLSGGTLLCAVVPACSAILFSCYADNTSYRRVFIAFMLLSTTALVQYAAMFYIVVLLLGLAQMRVFNLRSLLAGMIGVITPLWIGWAFGVIDLSELRWPSLDIDFTSVNVTDVILNISTLLFTAALGLIAMCVNLYKTLGYNAKYRAFNGFLSLLLIFTIVLMLVDYNNLSAYVLLLNFTTAYQVAHYFSMHRNSPYQWAILSLIIIYLVVYVLQFFV